MDAIYRQAAEILEKVSNGEGSIRSLIYSTPNQENYKKLLKLSSETSKHHPYLERLLDSSPKMSGALIRQESENRWLCMVLLYEYAISKRLKKNSGQLGRYIHLAAKEIDKQMNKIGGGVNMATPMNDSTPAPPSLPRYVRINTLKVSTSNAITKLEQAGWEVIRFPEGISSKKYKKLLSKLAPPQVYIDPQLKGDELLVFPPITDIYSSDMVTSGELILQDKASCLPALVLGVEEGCEVVDACASPGMKTSHLAAIMHDKGTIWAFDKDERRCQTLKNMLAKFGVTSTIASNEDFLAVDVTSKKYRKVKYALVDPPCSGSGMVKRTRTSNDLTMGAGCDQRRLQKLANLQAMLLKHALQLPGLKRLVYSTCSIHEEENEQVVAEALGDVDIAEKYDLVDPMPGWPHRGSENYEGIGQLCLRTSPEVDLTTGFFIALFQRK